MALSTVPKTFIPIQKIYHHSSRRLITDSATVATVQKAFFLSSLVPCLLSWMALKCALPSHIKTLPLINNLSTSNYLTTLLTHTDYNYKKHLQILSPNHSTRNTSVKSVRKTTLTDLLILIDFKFAIQRIKVLEICYHRVNSD